MSRCPHIEPDFTRVKNCENDKIGTVADDLSVQVTVNYDDGTFNFLMKADYGRKVIRGVAYGWEIIEEEPDGEEETDPVPAILERGKAEKRCK